MAVTNFSYDPALPTTADWIRFRLGDNTGAQSAYLDDNEIAAMIAEGGSREIAAAKCADAIRSKLLYSTDRSIVGMSVTGRTNMANMMKELARELCDSVGDNNELLSGQTGQSHAAKATEASLEDQVQPSVRRGMWDNPGPYNAR